MVAFLGTYLGVSFKIQVSTTASQINNATVVLNCHEDVWEREVKAPRILKMDEIDQHHILAHFPSVRN